MFNSDVKQAAPSAAVDFDFGFPDNLAESENQMSE